MSLEYKAENREAVFEFSLELLVQLLQFPENTKVKGVYIDSYLRTGNVVVKIEHPDLKVVEPGTPTPVIFPKMYRDKDGIIHFESWGQE